ncbi:MAG: hypothetical protein ACRC7O_18005, partial [Fimbriiglobus sp.]
SICASGTPRWTRAPLPAEELAGRGKFRSPDPPDRPWCRWTTSGRTGTWSRPGDQGAVIQAARERCREHLRAGRDFAFNATITVRQTR